MNPTKLNSVGFILWERWISVPEFKAIYPTSLHLYVCTKVKNIALPTSSSKPS